MDYEGRDYTGLARHLVLSLVVLGSWRCTRSGCGGKKAELTAEQVCRALNARCSALFRRRRGTPVIRHTSDVIQDHQKRNRAAANSHKKRWRKCLI
jgi:hypothetical protein